jgi:putative tricarboxylic transport membrane protein
MAQEKVEAYQAMLAAMMETPEWEEVRGRMGLVNIYRPGAEFQSFLEAQEQQIGDLMRELGFL